MRAAVIAAIGCGVTYPAVQLLPHGGAGVLLELACGGALFGVIVLLGTLAIGDATMRETLLRLLRWGRRRGCRAGA
jgi:hypothetical protein